MIGFLFHRLPVEESAVNTVSTFELEVTVSVLSLLSIGQECTLILTEGDSAKTLAVSGLGVVGRDRYGVFPLKGKLLNVREATNPQVLKNEEIQVNSRLCFVFYTFRDTVLNFKSNLLNSKLEHSMN